MSDPSAQTIGLCQRGDQAAFAQLVAETQGGVHNLAYRILRDHQEAQDMTQEVYLRVWLALPGFRGDSKFSTWLYRIAINACLNRRRQLRGQLFVVDGEEALGRLPAGRNDPAAEVAARQESEVIWEAVDRLPDKYRLVIVLFYQQQMSYQEVAQVLSLPLGTVKAHLNRAREALARKLAVVADR